MANDKIRVLFLSAEVAPLAKVGGLGDVAGSLPPALKKLGADIRICMPLYGSIDRKKYKIKKVETQDPASQRYMGYKIWETRLPGSDDIVYLIEHEFFNNPDVYWGKHRRIKTKFFRGSADIIRFTLFTEMALAAAEAINFKPDIIHANDWHTSLASGLLHKKKGKSDHFKNTKVLYTIHNLANQGVADPEIVEFCGLKKDRLCIREDLKNGDLNFMVQGILTSDIITTVSPTYAREILTAEHGAGLEKLLRRRRNDIIGIVNGIDTKFFNPSSDKFIPANYGLKSAGSKKKNKLALQKKLGLPVDGGKALISIVSRLVFQKGLDLIDDKMIEKLKMQFVILGTGQREIERQLLMLAKKYPQKLKVLLKFDEALAHLIYAGSDIFLMPSRFEPCGLGQMIAMRYGTVPVVRATGGLKDTVKNFQFPITNFQSNPKSKIQNPKFISTGFVFNKHTPAELLNKLQQALDIFYDHRDVWRRLQVNGMKADFSWNKPAREYSDLYRKMIK